MKKYCTEWKQGDKTGEYRTLALTAYHQKIHDNPTVDYAKTIMTDTEVKWPFGLYTEILGITDRKKNKVQPFPEGTVFIADGRKKPQNHG